jgi:fluoride ion exporter CrcB/FEX
MTSDTGFLGAYTTFSSYELESFTLLSKANWLAGLGYWIGSPMLGMVSFYLGVASARIGEDKSTLASDQPDSSLHTSQA